MAGVEAVWGIDVGRCALKALRLRPAADGRVDIIGQEYVEHATIVTGTDSNRQAAVTEALEKFLSKNDITKDKVVIAVPGQHTLSRFSKLPPVEPKKIPDIVRYEADQQIPFDLDEVIWDYQIFQAEDSPDVEVGIFAMKRDLIREYLLPFEHAAIEPIAVQASPLALYNAAAFEERLGAETSVLLDIGAENTDLIVANKAGLWTRTIPMGGNKFTEALVKAFKLSFAKAENLKRTAASSKYARQVFQAMRPVFAELVQELSRSLGFYRSTHRQAELTRIIGMGNAFKLPGLQKYLQQNLQLPVERPETFVKANIGDIRDADAFRELIPSYLVAYGLALQGLELVKALPASTLIRSNLLPPEIVKQVIWRKKKPYFSAAAACLLLAAGAIWFRQSSDLRTLERNAGGPVAKLDLDRATNIVRSGVGSDMPPRQEAATILAAAKAFETELSKYKGQGTTETERSTKIVKLQQQKAVWPRILEAIHKAVPPLQAKLAGAKDAGEFARAIREDSTGELARAKRSQVFIEDFSAVYSEDLDKIDLLDVERGDSGADLIEGVKGQPRKGFLVTLNCRTPHAGRLKFVADTIKADLRKHGRQEAAGFYINRVVLTKGRGFNEKEEEKGGTKGPSGRGGRGAPAKTTAPSNKFDPVTDEPLDQDWIFELKFDVVLADLPPPKDKPAGTTG